MGAERSRSTRADATRERLLVATEELLAERGSHGAGLNEVCARSGVAYGSLYHQFPDGKSDLVATSVRRSGAAIGELLEVLLDQMPLTEAVAAMFANGIATVERSAFARGCPVGTPAATGDDESLRAAATEVFIRWRKAIAKSARRDGRNARTADDLAIALVSLYEGALLVARTERSTRPLRAAAWAAAALVSATAS
jgi:TetR/AcrR family transcriptional regulator, lmrAB and yxaGH operons repressor